MSRAHRAVRAVLGCLAAAAIVGTNGCGEARPAVTSVTPEVVRPDDTLKVVGQGLAGQVVKLGDVEAQVKARAADSVLVVRVPHELKPGTYDLVVTRDGAKAVSKPVKVRVLDVVTVPTGTPITVRVLTGIGSGQSHAGDTFGLALDEPLVVANRTVAAEGSDVLGRVTQAQDAGRVQGRAVIEFTLIELKAGTRAYPLVTGNALLQGESTKGRDVLTIAGGTGLGAAIGGIVGGKKGAIIGAGAGGAAGTGVVLAGRGKAINIGPGARFTLYLSEPVAVQMGEAPPAVASR